MEDTKINMSNYTVISRVGNTIVNLLREKIKNIIGNINDTDIILGSPEESVNAVLTVFLYRIDENSCLKNRDFINPDPSKTNYAYMALDLYYLIIANSNSQNSKASEEHDIIGAAMQVLYENPVFCNYIEDGHLVECGQEFRTLFQPLTLEQLSQLWNASQKLTNKTFVSYLVTPVLISSGKPKTSVPRVVKGGVEYMVYGREDK